MTLKWKYSLNDLHLLKVPSPNLHLLQSFVFYPSVCQGFHFVCGQRALAAAKMQVKG